MSEKTETPASLKHAFWKGGRNKSCDEEANEEGSIKVKLNGASRMLPGEGDFSTMTSRRSVIGCVYFLLICLMVHDSCSQSSHHSCIPAVDRGDWRRAIRPHTQEHNPEATHNTFA